MSLDPQEVESLFDRAVQRQPADRAAFLTEACGDNHALHQRVEELLLAGEAETGFLPEGSGLATSPPEIRQTRLSEEVGFQVDRYKLLEKLGEGGFGAVWAADQKEPVRRRVALKIIKLGMDTEQVVARFEAERQALAMMDHPNIAKVLDAGKTETGRPYFVMELVKGMPITKYCDQEKLGTRARLDLFIKVCQAIQHAHQKGIIHRDIKPSNVMVTLHDGIPVPKVIDFGIAKATQADLTDKTIYTQYSQFIGTPAYMSPEQAEMSGLDIDTRADIYSLGVLLYELLTGSTPFDTKELINSGLDEMRKIIREQEPVKPSTRLSQTLGDANAIGERELRPAALPSDLDWIVMKCLEKDRSRRYETANSISSDVRRHLDNQEILARPPSTLYRLQKTWRRNRLKFAAGIAVTAAMLIGTAVSLWQANVADRAREETDLARIAEQEQKRVAQLEASRATEAEARERDLRMESEAQELAARQRAYAADMRLCQRALASNNLREARQLLDRQRPGEGEADLRGWEWRHLWQRCQSGARFELGSHEQRVLSALFVRNDQSVVTFEDGGKVTRWNLGSRTEETTLQERESSPLTSLQSNGGYLCVSDDGERIAAAGRRDDGQYVVRIWDMDSMILVAELDVGDKPARALALSPDKKFLVTVIPELDVAVAWDIATKKRGRTISLGRGSSYKMYGAVRYSPDGTQLAIGGGDQRVQLLDFKSGKAKERRLSGQGLIMTLDFSPPDGRFLAVGRGFTDPRISVLDLDNEMEETVLKGHRGFIAGLAFSPDGKTLASASGDQTIKLWNTGSWLERATLLGHTDEVWSLDFSQDGKTLLSGGKDGRVFVWSVAEANRDRATSLLHTNPLNHEEFAIDGKSNVSVKQSVAPQSAGTISYVDVSPDGAQVITVIRGAVHLRGRTNSIPDELGMNVVSASWAAPNEILLGVEEPFGIKVWNPEGDTIAAFTLKARRGRPSFVFLPGSQILVAAMWDEGNQDLAVTRWDVATRRELSSCVIEDLEFFDLRSQVSQDGHWLATRHSVGRVEIYDLRSGQRRTSFKVRDVKVKALALSPDGTRLATTGVDVPRIDIWNVATGMKTRSLQGHNLVVSNMKFSPDGKRLVTSTIGFEPVKFWDTDSWQTVFSFDSGPGTFIWNPWFLSDGNTLAFSEAEPGVRGFRARLWQAPSTEAISATKAEEGKQVISNK